VTARLCLATGLALLAALASPLVARQATEPKQTFRTGIDAVTVDVSVTDSNGNPVTDLSIDDFEIKQAGKVQKIESFKRFTTAEADTRGRPVAITSLAVQEREAARDDVRLIAIFLDDYHTRVGNAMSIREKIARFVESLDPRDMVAVMYPLTPSTGITFSRNHDGTARTIRQFEGRKYNYIPRFPEEEVYHYMTRAQIEALRNRIVIDALTGLSTVIGSFRHGRKTILMVGEGLTSYLPPQVLAGGPGGSLPPFSGLPLHRAASPTPAADLTSDAFTAKIDLLYRMKDIFLAAQRGNAAVYTLDPRGLAVFEFDLGQPAVDLGADKRVLQETTDSLHILADNTGGRAIVDSNDPQPGLQQMLVDASAYYLLGYTSTEAPRDGKFHEISVRVKRKGVEFRARKGYWAYSADDVIRVNRPGRPALASDMAAALASAASPGKLRVLETWVGFDRDESDGKTAVTVVWEASAAAPQTDRAERATVTVTSRKGDLLFRGRSPRDPRSMTPAGQVKFSAPPGPIHVRVVAEGGGGQALDSDERDISTPDFTPARLSLATPLVYRARTAGEFERIRTSGTALPTAARQFARSDQILLRVRAYGPGGTNPTLTARLLNSQGDRMSDLPAPQARGDGSFDMRVMPAGLVPGTYVIEIDAASGEEPLRLVWGFSIDK
jgi:VWFA-related protein